MQAVKFPIECTKIISEQEVIQALDAVATKITRRLGKSNPIVVSVLHGGLVFSAELLTRFNFALQQDYLHATRYAGALSGGELQWIAPHTLDFTGRTVLLVDDIFDEGHTLKDIYDYCYTQGAQAVYSAVFVKKSKKRTIDYTPDFYAVTAVDRYLFGMGMDYHGYWRNKKAVYALNS